LLHNDCQQNFLRRGNFKYFRKTVKNEDYVREEVKGKLIWGKHFIF